MAQRENIKEALLIKKNKKVLVKVGKSLKHIGRSGAINMIIASIGVLASVQFDFGNMYVNTIMPIVLIKTVDFIDNAVREYAKVHNIKITK